MKVITLNTLRYYTNYVFNYINSLIKNMLKQTVNIKYNDLLTLINETSLLPGQSYRITDYITTTSLDYSISDNNRFDIIVVAISNNVLSEDAKAINNVDDTYFINSNLKSWDIKYSIYNDTSKFNWADSEGTGVIYFMRDEYGNEASYDFKNIRVRNANNSENLNFYYTFSEIGANEEIFDKSLNTYSLSCYDNIIRPYHLNGVLNLNRIIFVNRGLDYSCYGNEFGINCYNNTFTSNCTNNKLGNHCKQNVFGDNFQTNLLNNNCSNNVFNSYCYYNSFGNNCRDNKFGSYCDYNSFGNNCYENTIKGYCNSNSFANDCYNNTIGTYNYNNSFGDYCYYNTLGNNCYSNSFSNSCNYIVFGNNCSYNTLRNNCRYITFGSALNTASHYYAHNMIGDGVQYFVLKSNDTASSGTQIQHCIVAQGIKGSSSSPVSMTVSRNLTYETKIAYNSSGTLKKFCTGD